ncbi:hypothetical protein ACWEU6_05220 [Streptosporangium sandarakinum]
MIDAFIKDPAMTETDPSADLRSPSTEKHSRKSSAKAARIIGASARGVEMTKTVERYAPDLIQMIEAGEMSLNAAYQETRRRIIEARQLGLGPVRTSNLQAG